MIAFAFLDAHGLPTGGGTGPALPAGAVALTPPFTTIDLPRLIFQGGVWAERPALPRAVATKAGFAASERPPGAVVTVTDLGTGLELQLPGVGAGAGAEEAALEAALPEHGSFAVTVTGPRPWAASAVTITRGKGSPELAATALARLMAEATVRINARTGAVRLKVYTDIPGQDAIYLEQRAEALAYVASPQEPDTLDDYPFMNGEVGPGLTAPTAWHLAQIWLNRAQLFKQVGAATEAARQRAILAIAAAPDEAAIAAVETAFTEALNALPI